MPKVKVRFCLSGIDVNLDEISTVLELVPTKKRKRREFPEISIKMGLAEDIWELQIPEEPCKAVSIQIDKLKTVLFSKMQLIQMLQEKFQLKTTIVVVIHMESDDGPELVLTKENIQFLSLLDAEIGFDIYID